MLLNDTIVYGQVNGSAEIRAVISLGGNPYPNVTWVNPSDHVIEFSDHRFNTTVDEALRILQIESGDFGSYLFIAMNGIGNELLVDVVLTEASK